VPALSVLLPVRDAAPWLPASLRSLFRQTFRDFEIVAVDDGSTDGSGELLERAAADDSRLRVFHTAPRGLPLALNHALSQARAPLVARHDADDLSHRRRFELQRRALSRRPGCAVLGSRVRLFPARAVGAGMQRWIRWHNRLLDHEAIATEMLIDSPLAHGSAMIRRRWLERVGGWNESGWAEDLDLWVRLLEAGARFEKLGETLYGWRQRPDSATRRDPRYVRERFIALKCAALRRGFVPRGGTVRVVGVGESLARWTGALREAGFRAIPLEARRPTRALVDQLAPPVVLVYMAPESRQRWREALQVSDMRELADFRFVA
jgi:glycosyltransferase involved in cell wall biosynthesis